MCSGLLCPASSDAVSLTMLLIPPVLTLEAPRQVHVGHGPADCSRSQNASHNVPARPYVAQLQFRLSSDAESGSRAIAALADGPAGRQAG